MRQPSEVKIGDQTLKEILELHYQWRYNYMDGKQANLGGEDLREANLREANLGGANLCGAILRGADLREANLRGTNLCGADLRGANFRGADLCGTNLRGANLRGANLRGANLRGASLRGANFCEADLCGANLGGADLCEAKLCGANLEEIKYDERTAFFALQCPEEGSFIAYKRCGDNIVKLLIPEDAQRSSATTRKCRASKAYALAILDENGKPCEYPVVFSNYDNSKYIVGEMYFPDDFDEDRWNECSHGVHFFITMQEAINYGR